MAHAARLVPLVAFLAIAASTVCAEDEVRLVSGDLLRGKIVELNEKELILDHADLGRLTIPIGKIQTHSRQELAPVEAEPEAAEGKEEPTPLEGELEAVLDEQEKKKTRWKFSTTVGGSLTNDDEGEKLKFNLRSSAAFKDKAHDTMFRTSWIYSFTNRVTDENTFNVIGTHARRLGESRWFLWVKARYDYDDFRDWRQRITLHAGPGFDLVRKKKFDLSLVAGAGGRKEFGTDDDGFESELALGFSLAWRPRDRHKFLLGFTYYPGIGDDSHREITNFDWTLLIDRKIGMSLNTHIDWEYDSAPDSGFPPNTIRWTWGLQFDF